MQEQHKICKKCNLLQPFTNYYSNKALPDGKNIWCKTCWSKYNTKRYHDDKQKSRKRNEDFISRNRTALWQVLLNSKCKNCQISDPLILEFDHIDTENKLFGVGALARISKDKMLEEIKKCEILCRNCHTVKTQKQFNTWRHEKYNFFIESTIINSEVFQNIKLDNNDRIE